MSDDDNKSNESDGVSEYSVAWDEKSVHYKK